MQSQVSQVPVVSLSTRVAIPSHPIKKHIPVLGLLIKNTTPPSEVGGGKNTHLIHFYFLRQLSALGLEVAMFFSGY